MPILRMEEVDAGAAATAIGRNLRHFALSVTLRARNLLARRSTATPDGMVIAAWNRQVARLVSA